MPAGSLHRYWPVVIVIGLISVLTYCCWKELSEGAGSASQGNTTNTGDTGPPIAPADTEVTKLRVNDVIQCVWATLYTQHPLRGLVNVICAVFVGFLGAYAFYLGVVTGFIGQDSREKILAGLNRNPQHYWLFGGVIAGVFQWAQPNTFAPVQAFVLGATWPLVVTRMMSGDSELKGPAWDVDTKKQLPPDVSEFSGSKADDSRRSDYEWRPTES